MSKICCFAGHSSVCNTDVVYDKVVKYIETLVVHENVKEFWVGDYGDFDNLSKKAVLKAKEKFPDIKLNLIIPYLTKKLNEYYYLYQKKYDNIQMAEIPEKTPARFRVLKCNRYMVDNSDFMICYVWKEWGGAAKTLEYANNKKNIKIYNMA